jgi:hypothetical protein
MHMRLDLRLSGNRFDQIAFSNTNVAIQYDHAQCCPIISSNDAVQTGSSARDLNLKAGRRQEILFAFECRESFLEVSQV